MANFKPGLVHTPVTPFKADHSIDYETYAKLIEFHLKNGAEAIAAPMPAGEDMSLKDDEQGVLLDFVIKQVKGRVPVIAHVSDAGTTITIERAKHAAKAGAAAIVSHPPYFWHPKASMVTEHLAQIGNATQLPFFLCSPPVEDVGTPLTTEIMLDVIDRVPTLCGVVDATMDFVIMVETVSLGSAKRPGFQLIPGTDYMVPAGAIGGMGVFSPLAAVAPAAAASAALDGALPAVAPAVLATSLRTIGDLVLYQQLLASPAVAAAVQAHAAAALAPGLPRQSLPWPALVDQAATALAHNWYL